MKTFIAVVMLSACQQAFAQYWPSAMQEPSESERLMTFSSVATQSAPVNSKRMIQTIVAPQPKARKDSKRKTSRKPARCNTQRWSELVSNAAKKHRLPPQLIHAVICVESAGKPRAKSHAGAMGLMQLMPATAKRFEVKDVYDPAQNVNAGARYLAWLLEFMNYDLKLALAGYNAGEGAVQKYDMKIPPYKETQNYVKKVMGIYTSS